jgi:CMP-N,N'-diacetyllegionaminic acid synthase
MARMHAVGIIPARGGSKGVPRKNLRRLAGETLVARAVRVALAAETLDLVVVSTDDDEIAADAEAAGARVVRRPTELARDDSPTEVALLHALEALGEQPEWTVTLEPTAPFRTAATIDRCVRLAADRDAGAVVTVAENRASWGRLGPDGGYALLDPAAPRRRQEREPLYAESGTVWVTRTASLRASRSVLAEPVYAVVVDEEEALDVNSELDLRVAEAMLDG